MYAGTQIWVRKKLGTKKSMVLNKYAKKIGIGKKICVRKNKLGTKKIGYENKVYETN